MINQTNSHRQAVPNGVPAPRGRRLAGAATTASAPIVLSASEVRRAERTWRRGVRESLDAGTIATEIDYWARQRAVWLADLEAEDFSDLDADTLRAGIAYAEHHLAELTRQAERHARAMRLPGYPPLRPQEDRTARFRAAKWIDLVVLAQTLTGQEAIKSGKGRYRIRCPFHDDKHPSLIVYPPGKGWWCPVCHKGGDPVAFVAELLRCSVIEALDVAETLVDTYPRSWGQRDGRDGYRGAGPTPRRQPPR